MKYYGWIATVLLVLSGCSSQKVTTDYDPDVNFSAIKSVQVVAVDGDQSPSARNIQSMVEAGLLAAGIKVNENALDTLQIIAQVEQRENDSAFSIGLGTGSSTRNTSIGVGTSISIPVGDDMLDYQVITLELVRGAQIIWTATDSARIKVRDGKGKQETQQKLVDRLLEHFPVITELED
ncbi:DUF4136 domain-containing protein [Alteromonas oceanisediminis]|uniref:DUF4136 domain-containing protein n=1 Tax=Alteromonas oceanisediminis TaxID=2836180 RepID=UPI001BD9A816|nr:DUF4136 domain-containing protein [Alteromonas oceanisediminis]MBT0586111.1 DUF4136 domain-containing protein [Alteromonas oceanisediminis]